MYPSDNAYFNLLHAALTERQQEPCPPPVDDDQPPEPEDDPRLPLPTGTPSEPDPAA